MLKLKEQTNKKKTCPAIDWECVPDLKTKYKTYFVDL